ncbi:MAG: uracil-DNA glycosylase [Desulfuromonadaceae bacterium]|nr:uracil-DNA glycosylase [Desulfuromonadaceae bacterium]
MPDQISNDMYEAVGAARALLTQLHDYGVTEFIASAPREPAPCPPGESISHNGVPCRQETLEEITVELGDCQRCPLCEKRTRLVFGVGDPNARLVFVGEGPGREEDQRGEPFVGEAGQLLDRIIAAIGLSRAEVYICNVVKCRPPGNRDPHPEEIATCEVFLRRQLAAIQPEMIVALGKFAAQSLLRKTIPISQLRGHWEEYAGIPLMPTFHPAYLLRNPSSKREVWEDMKQVIRRLRENGERFSHKDHKPLT